VCASPPPPPVLPLHPLFAPTPLWPLQVDIRADNLQTPLMWAAIRGNVEMCAMLLEHGAGLEARDSLGATPLILTVQHAQHLTFLFLLDRGANPSAGDIRGATCVHWAAYKGVCGVGGGVCVLGSWCAVCVCTCVCLDCYPETVPHT
jgi:hypothetical protein